MKKIVSIFLVTIYGMCMVACGSRSSSTEVKDNVLTEEEKAEGYTLLFNGKDFTGWKMFNGGDVKGWQVEDGVIVGYGNGGDVIADTTIKVSTDIVTVKNYHNFQIKWDWKIGAQGNSGFLYQDRKSTRQNSSHYITYKKDLNTKLLLKPARNTS